MRFLIKELCLLELSHCHVCHQLLFLMAPRLNSLGSYLVDLWRKSCIPRLYRRDHRMEYWSTVVSTVVAKSSGGRRNRWSRVSSTHLPSAMNFDNLTVGAQVLNDGCDI